MSNLSVPITTVWRGEPYPRGATWDGVGVNFALFSEHAERVELCIFDSSGRHELQRIDVKEHTDLIWHCYLPEARPGLLYGYRVHGPYRPQDGHRFNPNKLVLDAYAKSLHGTIRWSDAHFGYRIGSRHDDLSFDRRDNAQGMPKCCVIDPAFTWGDDHPPKIPWNDMVIYEAHVKGLTMRHPEVPPQLRGTYAGLATAPVIEHLTRLSITTVELLPVHAFVDDRRLTERGLRNYWGYNTLSFFAPDLRYSASGRISEFRTMVKALHAAGIEVILDVVYNHTAEGNQLGPTLSLRGLDNASYYRLMPNDRRFYMDFTGCGNTLNVQHPRVLQLIMDSLRYWVEEMHVDGFRFDLAAALAREFYDVDRLGAFFDILRQDPVLSRVKLIAEPWDLGEGGYHVGNFPIGWAEWNDRYRDTVRAFWKGDGGLIGEFARRITGSSDLYESSGRRPHASINFITAHDGFTMRDLVSYNTKHNSANLEDNRDGNNNNLSWNCGAEGQTVDPKIIALRARQMRNFFATLILSQGVPMLLAGDELCRSQGGNNNAYCQDNEVSWFDWDLSANDQAMVNFVRRVINLRQHHPIFRRRNFFQGRVIRDNSAKDIAWLSPEGHEMTDPDWNNSFARCLGVYLAGDVLDETDEHGNPIRDDNLLLLINGHFEAIPFVLPRFRPDVTWHVLLDTHYADGLKTDGRYAPQQLYTLEGRTLCLLREVHAP